jgi:hypothetical protein
MTFVVRHFTFAVFGTRIDDVTGADCKTEIMGDIDNTTWRAGSRHRQAVGTQDARRGIHAAAIV